MLIASRILLNMQWKLFKKVFKKLLTSPGNIVTMYLSNRKGSVNMETTKIIDEFLKDVTTPAWKTIDYIENGQRYAGNERTITTVSDNTGTSHDIYMGVATKLVNNATTKISENYVNVDVNKLLKVCRYMKEVSIHGHGVDINAQKDGFQMSNHLDVIVTVGNWDTKNKSYMRTIVDPGLLIATMTMEKRLGSKTVRLGFISGTAIIVDGNAMTLVAINNNYY